jgi:transposase
MLSLMKKRDARSLDHRTLEEMRRLAVKRVLGGESQAEVAGDIEVHHNTVNKWIRTLREEGEAGLASTKASGRPPTLAVKEQQRLFRIIVGKTPAQLNFGPALWTLSVVGDMIEKLFRKKLHVSNISRLLHRLGLTPQKPARRAIQQDEEEIHRWMREEFPAIVKEAQRKQASLLFADETGVREDAAIATTWGERGSTPIVKLSGTRRRINVISAVSPHGRLWFRCFSGNLNAALFIEFLEALLHDIRKKIVLVIDRHPAHRAASVLRFLREHQHRLSVHFLPAYAPELNPDEHAWSALKRLFRTDPLGADENIEDAVSAVMHKIQRDRSWVRSFFKHPEVAYVKEALRW